MTNEEYIDNELAKINLDWHEKKVNDIDVNPIECWWTVGEFGTLKRFYKIVPWSKTDARGMVLEENKYFCLWEACGVESDKTSMVAIYENLDEAKERAKFQLLVIMNIIQRYCPNDSK